MTDHDPMTRTEGEGETLDMPEGLGAFSQGQVLGERYQILEMLGRGGMGEVWHAFDLKLRVDVALKALREDFFKSERRLELLRQEVRAAREVVSPNVCRIFDLIEIEGRELVSMEYVDGATLLGVLQERGPLDLKEAQDIASQFLAGLEAIHKVGLIHRDIKPENIMLTRAGRVVVMDFGLARQEAEGGGSVSGTPAYMAPEQAAGQTVDARADVYAAGVVLAEMVSPDGIKSYESRQSVWEGVRSEPAKLPDSPWAPVLKRAVAKDREGRFNTARTLTRALEDVTLRVEGAEDLHPYPGLASYTEEDAEYFFGREAEIEQMWRKLDGPPRMLALVGPSGAGKSSFIRAGLFAAAPPSWSYVVSNPGNAAISSLGRVMAREMAGDADMVEKMMDFDDPEVAVEVLSSWGQRNDDALLVVDQFEELFTQNPTDEQKRVADLLSRLVLEADVHVLLSMRDDFFFHCHQYDAFAPLQDGMTLIGPPVGGALRRALVRPATKCGYRFEDDELVEQMLAEVEGERGALPLLAFAAAQLWEQRDRETGHLTREAYHDIGGVGGALARHAEATIDRIGTERVAHVRELFRNLVTAEGTRAVREWTELLSVFEEPQRESAEEVLRELIDARLLTSYEVREDDHEPTRRVEIIHESLLANWPRLVRWQTQDQEGAQIRDELRQAARSWDEHGRHDDRLWAGTAYREFQLWRERYPGGLTEAEEAFAAAMTSLATRRRRRRRISVAAAFAILLTVLAVVGSFWRRSVLETRRAEAAELVAHGQLELNGYPTASLAHAITSLELSDSRAARMLAVEALWKGPTAFVVNETSTRRVQFTSDGQWLTQAVFSGTNEPVRLIGADGSSRVLPKPAGNGNPYPPEAGGNSDLFSMQHWGRNSSGKWFPGLVTLWSAAEARILGEARYEGRWVRWVKMNSADRRFLVFFSDVEGRFSVDTLSFDGTTSHLGTREFDVQADGNQWRYSFDARTGRRVATSTGHDIYAMEVNQFDLSKPRFVGRQLDLVSRLAVDPIGRFIATSNDEGRIQLWDLNGMDRPRALEGPPAGSLAFTHDGRYLKSWVLPDSGDGEFWIWSLDSEEPQMMRQLSIGQKGPMSGVLFDPLDRHLVRTGFDLKIRLWPFSAPADAEPLELLRGEVGQIYPPTFHPQGTWLASADEAGLALWPLARRYPSVMRRHSQGVNGLVFGPQGRWFASSSYDGSLRLWPLDGEVPEPGRALFDNPKTHLHGIATSPRGDRILVAAATNRGAGVLFLIDLNGEPPQVFAEAGTQYFCAALSPDGRLAAGSSGSWGQLGRYIGVWDIASEEQIAVLAKDESPFYPDPRFIDDHHIMGLDVKGVRRWDINTGESSMLHEGDFQEYSASGDGRRLLLLTGSTYTGRGSVIFVDLESNAVAALETHGADVVAVKLDVTGKIAVTASSDGAIRVGRVDGAEPYVLIGHENSVTALAIDPLGRWIASGSKDTTVRLWPMPDLSKPPLHTLPHDKLIAKLKTLTNVRVVRDEESPTGWKITHDPFPGWETVPTW